MSVLPSSASLASCFIVFVVLLSLTLTTSLYPAILHSYRSIDTAAFKASSISFFKTSLKTSFKKPFNSENTASLKHTRPADLPTQDEDFIPERLMDPSLVTPPLPPKPPKPRLIRYLEALIPRGPPGRRSLSDFLIACIYPPALVVDYLIPELQFPLHQYRLYRLRGNRFARAAGWRWHPLAFVRDVIRFLLLPVWAVLVVVLVVVSAVVAVFIYFPVKCCLDCFDLSI